jgi:hypothetical protein
MSNKANSTSSVNNEESQPADFLWGAAKTGRVIGRNQRQPHNLLINSEIKTARKVRGRWIANPRSFANSAASDSP